MGFLHPQKKNTASEGKYPVSPPPTSQRNYDLPPAQPIPSPFGPPHHLHSRCPFPTHERRARVHPLRSFGPCAPLRRHPSTARLPRAFLLLLLLLLGALATASASALSSGDHLPFNLLPADPAAGCRGSVAECLASDELGLGGDLHRRVLYGSSYISYTALRRGNVPCSHRGASYYNCHPGTQTNP